MERNSSLSAPAETAQDSAPVWNRSRKVSRFGNRFMHEPAPIYSRRLLFVHEKCGDFAGAEANIQLAGAELRARGYATSLLYEQKTGRNEQQWQQLFQPCLSLPLRGKCGAVQDAIRSFAPDLIYLHKLADIEVLE